MFVNSPFQLLQNSLRHEDLALDQDNDFSLKRIDIIEIQLHVNHFWEQKGYYLNFSRKVNSDKDPPMHGCSLQYSSCFSGPSHVFPACAGGG